jgi:hypothetical protein
MESPTIEETCFDLKSWADWELQVINAEKLGADEVFVRHTSDIVQDFCMITSIDERSIRVPLTRKVKKLFQLKPLPYFSEIGG